MKSTLSTVPISYKKMNVVASIIRGQKATTALAQLKLMPKKASQILYKLLASAIANAENNENQKSDNLIVSHVIVNKGSVMRRWRPVSRGRAHPYRKQTSNITIELSLATPEKPKKSTKSAKPAKATPKKTTSQKNNSTKSAPKKAAPTKKSTTKSESK